MPTRASTTQKAVLHRPHVFCFQRFPVRYTTCVHLSLSLSVCLSVSLSLSRRVLFLLGEPRTVLPRQALDRVNEEAMKRSACGIAFLGDFWHARGSLKVFSYFRRPPASRAARKQRPISPKLFVGSRSRPVQRCWLEKLAPGCYCCARSTAVPMFIGSWAGSSSFPMRRRNITIEPPPRGMKNKKYPTRHMCIPGTC